METEHAARITSSEMSGLWGTYLKDGSTICLLKHHLQHVDDPAIQDILEYSLRTTERRLVQLERFFKEENWPLPIGFSDEDVDLNAPRLFTDPFKLYYLHHLGMLGLNVHSLSVSLAARPDLYGFFTGRLHDFNRLHKRATNLLLEKGLYVRSPSIPIPDGSESISGKDFLGQWFSDNRPLTSLEIANLHANVQRNYIGQLVMTGFAQTVSNEKIRSYMKRGKEIAKKHVEVFSSILNQDDLPASVFADEGVTESTESPFSDKLLMFMTSTLNGLGLGFYGSAIATSLRKDLAVAYGRLSAEITKYASDGIKIMIDNHWFEQPPTAPDRDRLMKSGKTY
ncbi:MAG TPA: DUF3231 family protein [Bacillales bacterium]|nr:DUF3231 family protein [Bacillales bacterium]